MNRLLCSGVRRAPVLGATLSVLMLGGAAMGQVSAPSRAAVRQARQAQVKIDHAALARLQITTDSRIPEALIPFVRSGEFSPRGCVTCDGSEVQENEAGCGVPVDTVNGGCNSNPNVFTDINVGDSVCGTGMFDGTTRDTDWYRFTVTEAAIYTWSGTAEFDLLVGFVGYPCPQTAFMSFATSGACSEATVSQMLQPGTYVAFAAPQFTNVFACDQSSTYTARLAPPEIVGGCCTGDSCSLMTRERCATAGGSYLGDGTNCGTPPGYAAGTCDDGSFEDISASGAAGCTGDDCFSSVPIGFDFAFYGNTYNSINLSSNGYGQFGAGSSVFTNQPIPTAGFPDNLICPLWDDWRTDQGGTLRYQTLGSAGSRRFIAQWTNVNHFGGCGTSAGFQLVLYEGTGEIKFRYNGFTNCGGASVGVENSDGTVGTSVDPNSLAQNGCVSLTESGGESPCDDRCPADWNGDGFLNGQDFDDFVFDFEAGDADYNGDGFTNGDDFDLFVLDFEAGCE